MSTSPCPGIQRVWSFATVATSIVPVKSTKRRASSGSAASAVIVTLVQGDTNTSSYNRLALSGPGGHLGLNQETYDA